MCVILEDGNRGEVTKRTPPLRILTYHNSFQSSAHIPHNTATEAKWAPLIWISSKASSWEQGSRYGLRNLPGSAWKIWRKGKRAAGTPQERTKIKWSVLELSQTSVLAGRQRDSEGFIWVWNTLSPDTRKDSLWIFVWYCRGPVSHGRDSNIPARTLHNIWFAAFSCTSLYLLLSLIGICA